MPKLQAAVPPGAPPNALLRVRLPDGTEVNVRVPEGVSSCIAIELLSIVAFVLCTPFINQYEYCLSCAHTNYHVFNSCHQITNKTAQTRRRVHIRGIIHW